MRTTQAKSQKTYRRFRTPYPEGFESVNMVGMGQVKGLAGGDVRGTFVASLFGIAARGKALEGVTRLRLIFATQPTCATYAPQHFLNFFPDPQVQGSLRPTF